MQSASASTDTVRGDRDVTASEWDAVFWDVGGVILDLESVTAGHRAFLRWLCETNGVCATPTEALETWRETLSAHFDAREGTEFIPARDGYAAAIESIVGAPFPRERWEDRFWETVAAYMEPTPGSRDAIAELSTLEPHLGVVSDADRDELHFLLDEFEVHSHFDSIVTSEDVGRTKPDPAMFETALERADADPERSLMLGDRYRHDMVGAARLGLTTVAYGARDGDAVDYRIESDLTEILPIVYEERP